MPAKPSSSLQCSFLHFTNCVVYSSEHWDYLLKTVHFTFIMMMMMMTIIILCSLIKLISSSRWLVRTRVKQTRNEHLARVLGIKKMLWWFETKCWFQILFYSSSVTGNETNKTWQLQASSRVHIKLKPRGLIKGAIEKHSLNHPGSRLWILIMPTVARNPRIW